MRQRYGLFLIFSILTLGTALAQSLPYSTKQRTQINKLQQTLQRAHEANYQRAVAVAQEQGRPIGPFVSRGRIIVLHGIDELGNLIYVGNYSATRAGITTRTSSLYAGGSLGLSLNGSSASVKDKLGIWEISGIPRATHIELAGRINQRNTYTSTLADSNNHATHVAGIMIGAGKNPLVRGMAYGASLQSYEASKDIADMTAASPTLLVSNHSYGDIAGWYYNDNRTGSIKWEWYGDTTISATDDYKFGFYGTDARNRDQIVYSAPNYLPVQSAANDHAQDHPDAGAPYYLINSRSGNVISTKTRNNQTGYDQLAIAAVAKNVMSVAAVSNITTGYNQPSDIKLAYFSSWGPTDDGRIKPDIAGVGVSVLSSIATSDSSYDVYSGTSMASPNVAGSLLLLQEYYSQLNPGKYMRASTLKGVALHTTEEAGDATGPDYRFGWGLLNTERAARVIGNTSKTNVLDERTLAQGGTYSLPVTASGQGPLKVTICWTDPAGTASTASKANLDNRTPKLVNDLDVRVSDGTTTNLPWTLNPDNPSSAAAPGDNIRDNIEQILVANPVPGKAYTVTVSHKGTLTGSTQDYALIVSGVGGMTYCASSASSSADSRIDRVQFGSIDKAGSTGCTTYTDNLTAVTDVQVNQTLPLTVTVGSCGTARNTILKAFIDWNQDGDFDDANETVATSGVLANGATFTAGVTVPTTLTIGNYTRLRLVLSATEDASTVTACGAYSVGETQDYVLHYVGSANDVGATALLSPQTNFCSAGGPASDAMVKVRVRNFGSAIQQNVPVSIQILNASNAVVTTLTGTVASLAAYDSTEITLSLPAGTQLSANQTYRFVISTSLAGDQNTANNQYSTTLTTAPDPGNGIFSAISCSQDALVTLANANTNGTAFWYDSPTGGTLLAAGNRTAAPNRPVYYASLNEFSGEIGPVTKAAFGGGSYGGGYITQPLISTKVPLLLESARLYIGTAGQLTFTVRKLDGTAVSNVVLDVEPTRTTSTTLTDQLPDDPNDPGAIYQLNLRIPQAGDYKITVDYDAGVTIFRSNTAVTGFPFSIPNVVTIKGSLFANATTGTTDTLTNAWYYFYNLQVRSLGCGATQRVAVTPTTAAGTAVPATITATGSTSICQGASVTLQANTGDGLYYQWLRNGQPITGATSSTYAAGTVGTYTVQVGSTCQPTSSSAVVVQSRSATKPVVTANGFSLTTNAVSSIQWLRNGVVIPGATSPTYSATATGNYSVRGNVDGCGVATSATVYVAILATDEPVSDLFRVYPNPTNRLVTVEIETTTALTAAPTLQLMDSKGAQVQKVTMQRDGKQFTATLDVSALPGGTFFVAVQGDQQQTLRVKRITKQ